MTRPRKIKPGRWPNRPPAAHGPGIPRRAAGGIGQPLQQRHLGIPAAGRGLSGEEVWDGRERSRTRRTDPVGARVHGADGRRVGGGRGRVWWLLGELAAVLRPLLAGGVPRLRPDAVLQPAAAPDAGPGGDRAFGRADHRRAGRAGAGGLHQPARTGRRAAEHPGPLRRADPRHDRLGEGAAVRRAGGRAGAGAGERDRPAGRVGHAAGGQPGRRGAGRGGRGRAVPAVPAAGVGPVPGPGAGGLPAGAGRAHPRRVRPDQLGDHQLPEGEGEVEAGAGGPGRADPGACWG